MDIHKMSDLELLNHITDLNNQRLNLDDRKQELLEEMAVAILYAKTTRPGVRMNTIAQRLHVSRQRAYQIAELAKKENRNADL